MIVTGVSWLVAGAVAGSLSESATQLRPLREASKLTLLTLVQELVRGLRDALYAPSHHEFVSQYAAMMRLAFRWLKAQLRQLAAQLLVGSSVYFVAYFLLGIIAIEFLSGLQPSTCDVLFVIGACATYALCKWSRVRHLQLQP